MNGLVIVTLESWFAPSDVEMLEAIGFKHHPMDHSSILRAYVQDDGKTWGEVLPRAASYCPGGTVAVVRYSQGDCMVFVRKGGKHMTRSTGDLSMRNWEQLYVPRTTVRKVPKLSTPEEADQWMAETAETLWSPQRVIELVGANDLRDRKILAIKTLRDHTGMSLTQARDLVYAARESIGLAGDR